jgi:hypothetical protein
MALPSSLNSPLNDIFRLLIIQPEPYGAVVNFPDIFVMVAGTALEPMNDELFAGFGFFPALLVANNHHSINASIFLMVKGYKMTSWQPLKSIFASPFLASIEVAMRK